jgi:hypothetical protein
VAKRPAGLSLPVEDRAILERCARSQTLPYRQVRCCQILIALAKGRPQRQVAAQCSVSRATVIKCRDRYRAQGLVGLARHTADRRGRGAADDPGKSRSGAHVPSEEDKILLPGGYLSKIPSDEANGATQKCDPFARVSGRGR